MPGADRAEIYFIASMMFLIIILCVVAVYFFFKTYKKEMREKERRDSKLKQSNGVQNVGNAESEIETKNRESEIQ